MAAMTRMVPLDDLGEISNLSAVIIDTNLLDSMDLLQTPESLTLLFHLGRAECQLALPEIIEHEWHSHYTERVVNKLSQVNKDMAWLHGLDPDYKVLENKEPSEIASRAFRERLEKLGDLLITVPIGKEDWKKAGRMVIEKLPPSKPSSQQFKDSLLWCAAISVSRETSGDVILITKDKGFLDSTGKRLADNLAIDAEANDAQIYIASGVDKVLSLVATDEEVHASILTQMDAVDAALKEAANTALLEFDFVTGQREDLSFEAYATEAPNEVFIFVRTEYELLTIEDPYSTFADGAISVVEGNVLYDLRNETVRDVQLRSVETTIFTPHQDIVHETRWTSSMPAKRRAELVRYTITGP